MSEFDGEWLWASIVLVSGIVFMIYLFVLDYSDPIEDSFYKPENYTSVSITLKLDTIESIETSSDSIVYRTSKGYEIVDSEDRYLGQEVTVKIEEFHPNCKIYDKYENGSIIKRENQTTNLFQNVDYGLNECLQQIKKEISLYD